MDIILENWGKFLLNEAQGEKEARMISRWAIENLKANFKDYIITPKKGMPEPFQRVANIVGKNMDLVYLETVPAPGLSERIGRPVSANGAITIKGMPHPTDIRRPPASKTFLMITVNYDPNVIDPANPESVRRHLEPLSRDLTGKMTHEITHFHQYKKGTLKRYKRPGNINYRLEYHLDPKELEAIVRDTYNQAKAKKIPWERQFNIQLEEYIIEHEMMGQAINDPPISPEDIKEFKAEMRLKANEYVRKTLPAAQFERGLVGLPGGGEGTGTPSSRPPPPPPSPTETPEFTKEEIEAAQRRAAARKAKGKPESPGPRRIGPPLEGKKSFETPPRRDPQSLARAGLGWPSSRESEMAAMEELKKGPAANQNTLERGGIDPVTKKPRTGALGAAYFGYLGTEVFNAGFGDYLKKAIGNVTGNEDWKSIETKGLDRIAPEMAGRIWDEFVAITQMPKYVGDYLTTTFYENLGQPPADAGLKSFSWDATSGDLRSGRPMGSHRAKPQRQPWTPETVEIDPTYQAAAEEQYTGSEEAVKRWMELAGVEPDPTRAYTPKGKAGTLMYTKEEE